MFGDNEKTTREDLEHALDAYSVEEILEHNDMTLEDVLFILLNDGYIILPEINE